MFPRPLRPSCHRLSYNFRDLRDLVNAHERIHFGQQFGQFITEALGQAAGNDEALTAIFRRADFGGFEDGIHALLLRRVNERAGVDDDGVGLRGVVGDFHAVLEQRAEHDFGVHQIFGTAERNQADPQRVLAVICFGHRLDNLRDASLGMQQCR